MVKLHNFCQLGIAQPCFKFVHPNRAARIDNTRSAAAASPFSSRLPLSHADCLSPALLYALLLRYQHLSFPVSSPATVHGLAGYFEAKLYGDIAISIVPQTFSHGTPKVPNQTTTRLQASHPDLFLHRRPFARPQACSAGSPCTSRCATRCWCGPATRSTCTCGGTSANERWVAHRLVRAWWGRRVALTHPAYLPTCLLACLLH